MVDFPQDNYVAPCSVHNSCLYWQLTDNKILKRINTLLQEITCQPYEGIGDAEPLKHNWAGYWSRRIVREHRLVYKVRDEGPVVI